MLPGPHHRGLATIMWTLFTCFLNWEWKKGARALWYSQLSLHQLFVFISQWTTHPCILYQVCVTHMLLLYKMKAKRRGGGWATGRWNTYNSQVCVPGMWPQHTSLSWKRGLLGKPLHGQNYIEANIFQRLSSDIHRNTVQQHHSNLAHQVLSHNYNCQSSPIGLVFGEIYETSAGFKWNARTWLNS